jgi:predicted dehydrogenase
MDVTGVHTGTVATVQNYCLIGLGQRALGYVKYINKRNLPFRLVGVYDTNPKYQKTFLTKIKRFVPEEPVSYKSLSDMKDDLEHIHLLFICTPDHTHLSVLSSVVDWNIHIILEKPITTNTNDSIELLNLVGRNSSYIHVPLVLRFTNHYETLKKMVSSEQRLGGMVQVQMTLSLSVSHTASYQRRWHRLRSKSGGFITTKCCHDIDLLHWIIDSQPTHISSFSRNKTFKQPKKADGCAKCSSSESCAYTFDGRYVLQTEMEDIGVYDRCVYDDKNESVDGQAVMLMYENGVLCNYNIHMFQPEPSRKINIVFEKGTVTSCFKSNKIQIMYTDGSGGQIVYPEYDAIGHNGGDIKFLEHVYSKMVGEPSHTLLEESVKTMNTCECIIRSSDTNTVVS